MRVKSLQIVNFFSYKELSFDFESKGLTLIHGPTGSGKSTLADAVPWVLFGCTAKNGSVDEVRSWFNNGEHTKGVLTVELENEIVTVTRIRGEKQNDLFFTVYDGGLGGIHTGDVGNGSDTNLFRGKDITETQSLLEDRIGLISEDYVSGAYYHEFCPSASFFTSTATKRREFFEGLADLRFSVRLERLSSELLKKTRKEIDDIQGKISFIRGNISSHEWTIARSFDAARTWEKKQKETIQIYEEKNKTFEKEKKSKLEELRQGISKLIVKKEALKGFEEKIKDSQEQIKHLDEDRCGECGASRHHALRDDLVDTLYRAQVDSREYGSLCKRLNDLELQTAAAEKQDNDYPFVLGQLKVQRNPHDTAGNGIQEKLTECRTELQGYEDSLYEKTYKLNSIKTLSDLLPEFRASKLTTTVSDLEERTNGFLTKYFDSEIKVDFRFEGKDKLEVSIKKNGYDCSFKQLSKGQRCLLRLCFSVAVMKVVSNKVGKQFNVLSFDEALDGMDASMKAKSFALFESLAKDHESVFVIEHEPEFQNLFQNKVRVALDGDSSVIEES